MWAIQQQTGWTDDYILWEVSRANLRMKLADALRYVKEDVTEVENFDEITFKCD